MAIPIDYGAAPLVKRARAMPPNPYALAYTTNSPYANTSQGFKPQNPYPNTNNNPYNTIYQGYKPQYSAATGWAYQKPAVAATKTTTAPPSGGPSTNQAIPPGLDLSNLDYSHDPVLENLIASQNTALGTARNSQLEQQKQLLLSFGSQEMARKLLGDDPFVNTVSADPNTSLSTLGISKRQELDAMREADETVYGPANLNFSSARTRGLADITRQRILRDAGYETDMQAALQGLTDQYGNLVNQFGAERRSAEQQAYDRAIQMAISKFLYGGGAGTGAGAGGSTATTPGPGTGPGGTFDPNTQAIPVPSDPGGYDWFTYPGISEVSPFPGKLADDNYNPPPVALGPSPASLEDYLNQLGIYNF
jgi:hypothetical protein